MIITKLPVLLLVLQSTLSWLQLGNLTSLLLQTLPPGLTNFTSATNYSSSTLIIYGGTDGTTYSNRTFLISLNNLTATELVYEPRPPTRINSCAIILQDAFFLYGGTLVQGNALTPSPEFWMLNLTLGQWQLINNTMEPMRMCLIQVYSGNRLIMFGISYGQFLELTLYNSLDSTIRIIDINFINKAIVQVMHWDGLKQNVTIPIQQVPVGVKGLVGYTTTKDFPMDDVSFFQISNSLTSKRKQMQVKSNIYLITYNHITKQMWLRFSYSKKQYMQSLFTQSISLPNVSIYCIFDQASKRFHMEYKNNTNLDYHEFLVSAATPNFYNSVWPDFSNSSGIFSLMVVPNLLPGKKTIILLILHSTYLSYILFQDVFNYSLQNAYPTGLSSTYYGLNQCHSGWRGKTCSERTCPNSMALKSVDGLRVISFDCSGNGVCVNGSCVCDSLWTGPDCSIYKRKACHKQLISNFPLSNCECMDPTIGGNDCSIQFCPSDCTGHGTCQSGACVCDPDYYGADCSIMVIGFPQS